MSNSVKLNRRSLLKRGGGVGVAVAVATTVAGTINDAQAYDPGQNERRARYRADAADVQAFYRTNGYETLKR